MGSGKDGAKQDQKDLLNLSFMQSYEFLLDVTCSLSKTLNCQWTDSQGLSCIEAQVEAWVVAWVEAWVEGQVKGPSWGTKLRHGLWHALKHGLRPKFRDQVEGLRWGTKLRDQVYMDNSVRPIWTRTFSRVGKFRKEGGRCLILGGRKGNIASIFVS